MRKSLTPLQPGGARRRAFLDAAAALGLSVLAGPAAAQGAHGRAAPDLILHHARITTLDAGRPEAEALALKDGLVQAVGSDRQILALADAAVCRGVHGHDHLAAASARVPTRDSSGFWGALGCSCFL